jgi:hypothetical protein
MANWGSDRGRVTRFSPLLAVMVLLALAVAACGDGTVATTEGGGSTTTEGGDATTTGGDGGGTVPLEGSSSCSDPTGDTDQEIYDVEGWPEAFDLTGVEVTVEGSDLVITAHFAGDVTQDSRVELFLGDLTGFSWDGHSITLDWDYFDTQGWAATIDTMPFTEEVVLPVVTVEGNLLVGRVPLENLPLLQAPFQWFAFVGLADFCPDGNLQGTANNPVTFPG